MDAIGIRITFKKDKMPELRKMARQGQIPMRADGWNADYPDAENFMQLLYGPNGGPGELGALQPARIQRAVRRARTLPDSPERTAVSTR